MTAAGSMKRGISTALPVIGAGVCLLIAGCVTAVRDESAPEAPGAPADFNMAVRHARSGRHQEAIESYRKVIDASPADAMARYGLGIACVAAGDFQGAREECGALRGLNPELADRLLALAARQEKASNEIMVREKAVRMRPNSAAAYFNLGTAYAGLERHQPAVEAFKQAARIRPESARVHYELGLAYSKLGRQQEAADAFKEAVSIRPDYAEAHYHLGVVFSKLGKHREALEAYEQAIRLDPGGADAHYLLGVTYGKLGRPEQAIESLQEVIRIDPGYAEAYYGLAVVYLGLGDARRALELQKKLKGLDGTRAENLFTIIFPAGGAGG